jgi:hypothetical protein
MSTEQLARLSGKVTQFDEFIGLGEITDTKGRVWPFHCVSIADGTRTIPVGIQVSFTPAFRVSRSEAVSIIPL